MQRRVQTETFIFSLDITAINQIDLFVGKHEVLQVYVFLPNARARALPYQSER